MSVPQALRSQSPPHSVLLFICLFVFLCKFVMLRFGPESFFWLCIVKCIFLEHPGTCSITFFVTFLGLVLWEVWCKSRSFLSLGFPLQCYCILPPLQQRALKSCGYHVWGTCWRSTAWKCKVPPYSCDPCKPRRDQQKVCETILLIRLKAHRSRNN